MKIEIWSDYVCPFCYIGRRRFEESLEKFPHNQHVTVEYKSYELAPDAETDPNANYYKTIATKFGISVEEAILGSARISRQAEEAGLLFNFDEMKPTNTFDAHRLAKFAAKHDKDKEMTERLLRAYFTESHHIGDHNVLKKLAIEVGLDEAKVTTLLASQYYSGRVREDEDDAQSIGVKTVPFFVFNEEYAVAGLQTTDVFTAILEQLWETRTESKTSAAKNTETMYCDGESCSRIEED